VERVSELVKISTKTYNSQLDEISNNDVDVYVKAKLKKRLTYGEYVGEPNNGFELVFGDTVSIMNLDKSMVYIHSKNNLNENQQTLLLWMKETECETDDPLEPISDLFLEGTPSKYFPDLGLSCVEAAYQSLNKMQKIGLVQEYLRQAQEQEEEHD
jgi:hypothetical protein